MILKEYFYKEMDAKYITAASSKLHRFGFVRFSSVISMTLQSILTGDVAFESMNSL